MPKQFLIQSDSKKRLITLAVDRITEIKEIHVRKHKWFLGIIPHDGQTLLKTVIRHEGFFYSHNNSPYRHWVPSGKIVLDCNIETALDILGIAHDNWNETTMKSDLKYGQHD